MSTHTLRSPDLEAAIQTFYNAFVDMLAVGPGQYIEREKMLATCQAGSGVISLLEDKDVPTPGVDALLNALDDVLPQLQDGESILADPFIRLSSTDCPPSLHRKVEELCMKANQKNRNPNPSDFRVKPPMGKSAGSTKPDNAHPAGKGPAVNKPKTGPSNPPSRHVPRPVDKPAPPAREEATRSTGCASQPVKTYQEIEDQSSGESESEYEQEIEKTKKQKKAPHPRKVIKTPAVITAEMDEDAEDWENADGEDADRDGSDREEAGGQSKGKRKGKAVNEDDEQDGKSNGEREEEEHDASRDQEIIQWSKEDRNQEKMDALWKAVDEDDPYVQAIKKGLVNKGLKTGPFYWGSYTAPLHNDGKEAITFEQLEDPRINPHDDYGYHKYILVNKYQEPCSQCRHTRKKCFFSGSKPNPLGKTVGQEREKAGAGACGECKAGKKRCFGKGRGRYQTIIRNPFYSGNKKSKGKVKIEPEPRPASKPKRSNRAAGASGGGGSHRAAASTTAGVASVPDGEVDQSNVKTQVADLEKTCQDLALKVVDCQAELRKAIEDAEDRMKREIRKLRQQHKTTTAYVEQKTCSVMEALAVLGNSMHEMMEDMLAALEGVPQGLQDVIDEEPMSNSVGLDADGHTSLVASSPLSIIQKMQDDVHRIAQLIKHNLPAVKRLESIAKGSRSPTPIPHPQAGQTSNMIGVEGLEQVITAEGIGMEVDQPDLGQGTDNGTSAASPPQESCSILPIISRGQSSVVPNGNGGSSPRGDGDKIPPLGEIVAPHGESGIPADGTVAPNGESGIPPNSDAGVLPNGEDFIHPRGHRHSPRGLTVPVGASTAMPDGEEEPLSPLSEEDEGAVGSKRKHKDEEAGPVEKKKKKAPAKKRPAPKRRGPHGRTADPAPEDEQAA